MGISWVRRFIRRQLGRLEIDSGVFFALVTRGWQLAMGPITLIFIARDLTPELQGYYYTFVGLLALQSFFELGLCMVVISLASHEWSKLRLDSSGTIAGDPDARSRLVSLGRFIYRWYAVVSMGFMIGVGGAGYYAFDSSAAHVEWRGPWITLVIATGLSLWALPHVSLLEGCNQITVVNRMRVMRAVVGTLALCAALVAGWGLWAAVVSTIVKLGADLYLLLIRFRRFFAPFWAPPEGLRIDWRFEIWPMQWKLALAGLMNFFTFSLFNPVMFLYHGPIVAGQMGMTLQIVSAVQMVGLAWVSAKTPQFGMCVAGKNFDGLDRLWRRVTLISMGAVVVVSLAIAVMVVLLFHFNSSYAVRVLPPQPTYLLLVAAILMHLSQCQSAYIIAHKQAPFVTQVLVAGIATGLLVWLLGSTFGPTGASVGYLLVVALFIIPYETMLWRRCRRFHGISPI